VLLHAGRIAATGTHEQLLATEPLYQQLTRLDALRSELPPGIYNEVAP